MLGHVDGMISATGLQDVVAVRGETLARHLPQRFFVFQQENCFCASWILASLFQAGNQWRSFFIYPRAIFGKGLGAFSTPSACTETLYVYGLMGLTGKVATPKLYSAASSITCFSIHS